MSDFVKSRNSKVNLGAASNRLQKGKYEIIEQIGRGGMGAVYLAKQKLVKRERDVAIKCMLPSNISTSAINRFIRECELMAGINHANIVTIYDVFKENGHYYLVMEYMTGNTLDAIMKKGKVEIVRTLNIIRQTAEALRFIHEQGIVHRDIKPENIFLQNDDTVKLGDFGLAKELSPTDPVISKENSIMGTPHYMSPEQIEGKKKLDGRSDIFSLGIVLYEMLAGRRPFEGNTVSSLFTAILLEKPIPLAKVYPCVIPELSELCMKSLAKNADDRYQNAREFMQAVDEAAKNAPEGKDGRAASSRKACHSISNLGTVVKSAATKEQPKIIALPKKTPDQDIVGASPGQAETVTIARKAKKQEKAKERLRKTGKIASAQNVGKTMIIRRLLPTILAFLVLFALAMLYRDRIFLNDKKAGKTLLPTDTDKKKERNDTISPKTDEKNGLAQVDERDRRSRHTENSRPHDRPLPKSPPRIWMSKEHYRNGEFIVINFSIPQECYVELFYITCKGEIALIFPNVFQTDNYVKPCEIYTVGHLGSKRHWLQAGPPYGTEYIQLIAQSKQFTDKEQCLKRARLQKSENHNDFIPIVGRVPLPVEKNLKHIGRSEMLFEKTCRFSTSR